MKIFLDWTNVFRKTNADDGDSDPFYQNPHIKPKTHPHQILTSTDNNQPKPFLDFFGNDDPR